MTDLRTSFAVLEDSGTQGGLPLHKVLEGDAYAGKNAAPVLTAKSGSNLVYLKVNPTTGALLTDSAGAIVAKMSSPAGELAAGAAAFTAVTNAEIVLTVDTVYRDLSIICSCQRDAIFQLIQQDDTTDTVIAEFIVGSGEYTQVAVIPEGEITAGSTGVQKLKVKAKNFNAQSSLRATIFAAEVQ